MFAIITLDCIVTVAPEYKTSKTGRCYCTFHVKTSNISRLKGHEFLHFQCFVWEGQTYEALRNMKVGLKDRIFVSGKYFTEEFNKQLWHKIYVQSIEMIMPFGIKQTEEIQEPEIIVRNEVQSFNGKENAVIDEDYSDW